MGHYIDPKKLVGLSVGLALTFASPTLAQNGGSCSFLSHQFTYGFAATINGKALVCNEFFHWQDVAQGDPIPTAICLYGDELYSEGARLVDDKGWTTCDPNGKWVPDQ